MPVFDPDNFDSVVASINKKYEGDLRNGDAYEHPERILLPGLAFNIASGGGFPRGRIGRFYGPYSASKSMHGWLLIAAAMEEGLSCCYWNLEKQYDPDHAADLGVDTEQLLVMEGTTIEEIGEKLEALLGVVHLHVIDSCSAAVSEDELNADVNAWRPGLNARAWGKVFRRIGERFDHLENTILLLDQIRTNFNTKSEEPPGGRMLDHASSMSYQLKKGEWLFRNEHGYLDPKAKKAKGEMADQQEPAGRVINGRIVKSRVCRPLIPVTMRLDFDSSRFDEIYEYIEAAKTYGVVEDRGGGNYYYPHPDTGKKSHRFYGEPKLRELIQGDLTIQSEIRRTALLRARQR